HSCQYRKGFRISASQYLGTTHSASREPADSPALPKSRTGALRSEQRFFRSNARSEYAILLCALRRGRRSRLGATTEARLDLPEAGSATSPSPAGHRLRLGWLGPLCCPPLWLPGSWDNNFA